jgi:hypothetical protein
LRRCEISHHSRDPDAVGSDAGANTGGTSSHARQIQSGSRRAHRRTERSLVLIVLDHPERCSRAELEIELHDIEPLLLCNALAHLHAEGVVILDGETVTASPCARHMDALGVIGV